MGCTGGTPGAAERASGPIVATARPTVAVPQAPQVRFPQLKPFMAADGDVDWFCASYRTLSPCKIYHDLARIRMQCCLPRAGLGNGMTTWILISGHTETSGRLRPMLVPCFPPVVRPR
jgi:hypothetical protein